MDQTNLTMEQTNGPAHRGFSSSGAPLAPAKERSIGAPHSVGDVWFLSSPRSGYVCGQAHLYLISE
jgi:hypothetical protein